jgi:hypothetical protein
MTSLEMRYRRLLRAYPSGHRAAYGEEMIGVLMSGSEPGRRFPSPADAFDLLRAGLTARLGRAFHLQRGTGWRDAAAVTGLFTALLLAGAAVGRLAGGLVLWAGGDPLRAYGVDGLMLLDPAARSVTWLLVVVAAVLGLRRAAIALAGAGVLVQAGTVWFWSAPEPARGLPLIWGLAAAIVVTALFVAAVSGRSARAVLGVRGLVFTTGAAVLVAVARSPLMDEIWFDGPLVTLTDLLQVWAPGLLLIVVVSGAGRAVGGRIAVLSAFVLSVAYVFLQLPGVVSEVRHGSISVTVAADLTVLLLGPVVILVGGVVALRVVERLADRGQGHVRAHE